MYRCGFRKLYVQKHLIIVNGTIETLFAKI